MPTSGSTEIPRATYRVGWLVDHGDDAHNDVDDNLWSSWLNIDGDNNDLTRCINARSW